MDSIKTNRLRVLEKLEDKKMGNNTYTSSYGDVCLIGMDIDGKTEKGKKSSTYSVGDAYLFKIDFNGEPEKENPKNKYEEDYKTGDLDKIAPGTYLEVIRENPKYFEFGLFGFTYSHGGHSVHVRGDLKGEAFRRVRDHEVYHWARLAGEEETRDATGTHMHEFLPLLERSRYRS